MYAAILEGDVGADNQVSYCPGHEYLAGVLAEADDLQHRLEDLLQTSQLPERPDYDRVNKFLAESYVGWWKRT